MQHYGTYGTGDREKFFFQLAFEPPVDPAFVASEEDALSWGSFQLWVDGRTCAATPWALKRAKPFTGISFHSWSGWWNIGTIYSTNNGLLSGMQPSSPGNRWPKRTPLWRWSTVASGTFKPPL